MAYVIIKNTPAFSKNLWFLVSRKYLIFGSFIFQNLVLFFKIKFVAPGVVLGVL